MAQSQTVEQVAKTIAENYNNNSVALNDDMIASSVARAVGKNVIFEYSLRVRQNLPPPKVQEFADYTRREVVPQTCKVQGNRLGFDRGMYYSFIYKSTYGELLTQFIVNKATCENYR